PPSNSGRYQQNQRFWCQVISKTMGLWRIRATGRKEPMPESRQNDMRRRSRWSGRKEVHGDIVHWTGGSR
ncbi:hypothetical protein V5O48_018908, partial [Marasmius crinis-equi]